MSDLATTLATIIARAEPDLPASEIYARVAALVSIGAFELVGDTLRASPDVRVMADARKVSARTVDAVASTIAVRAGEDRASDVVRRLSAMGISASGIGHHDQNGDTGLGFDFGDVPNDAA
jgi:hypothetical protein